DQLTPGERVTLDDVEQAYEEQVGYVERHGGRVILMASRALARAARSPDDYRRVYGTILRQVSRPVILHWLGDMFDPELAGYWGTRDLDQAMHACLGIIREHRTQIDGIKISLLDAEREVEMRALLPEGVRMYTGDDFNYDRLILGDGQRHSDALLGIFDAIAPACCSIRGGRRSGCGRCWPWRGWSDAPGRSDPGAPSDRPAQLQPDHRRAGESRGGRRRLRPPRRAVHRRVAEQARGNRTRS